MKFFGEPVSLVNRFFTGECILKNPFLNRLVRLQVLMKAEVCFKSKDFVSFLQWKYGICTRKEKGLRSHKKIFILPSRLSQMQRFLILGIFDLP